MGTLFLLSLSARPSITLQVHIYDTGFCPNLIKTEKNIIIKPVVDVTQKNNYTCTEAALKGLRFHGQWVLEEMISDLKIPRNNDILIEITPVIIFDYQGNQSLTFWKRAFEYSEKADIIFAAAGIPLPTEKELKESGKIRLPKVPLFLSAGRLGKNIFKEVPLFPQVHGDHKNIFIIGSYHRGLETAEAHFVDTQLMNKGSIDYYFPFEKPFGKNQHFKGTSYSLAKFGNFLFQQCLISGASPNMLECLKKHSVDLTLKEGKSLLKVQTLKRSK